MDPFRSFSWKQRRTYFPYFICRLYPIVATFFFWLMSDLHEKRSSQHSTFDQNVAKGWMDGSGVGWDGMALAQRGERTDKEEEVSQRGKGSGRGRRVWQGK